MTVDYTALRFWMDVGIYAFNIALGLYVWREKRKVKTAQRFQDLEEWKAEQGPKITEMKANIAELKGQCRDHKDQTSKLGEKHLIMQADFRNLPSREELNRLSEQMGSLSKNLGRMDGRLAGIGRAVDLMNQHLLKVSE